MSSPVLVVRAAVGAWTSIKYLLTRGLDIGSVVIPEEPPLVVSSRHTESPVYDRASRSPVYDRTSQSPVPNRHTVSGVR